MVKKIIQEPNSCLVVYLANSANESNPSIALTPLPNNDMKLLLLSKLINPFIYSIPKLHYAFTKALFTFPTDLRGFSPTMLVKLSAET